MLNVIFVKRTADFSDEDMHLWIVLNINSILTAMDMPECEFCLNAMMTERDNTGKQTDYTRVLIACKPVGEEHYIRAESTLFVFDGKEFSPIIGRAVNEVTGAHIIDELLATSGFPPEIINGQSLMSAHEMLAQCDNSYPGMIIKVDHCGVYAELFEGCEAHANNELYGSPTIVH